MNESQPLMQKKRFIESSSFYTNNTSKNPFSEMKVNDSSFLEDVPSRSPCPKCNRSRKYYCYTCYVAVQEVVTRLPLVTLPVQIDIIKHPKEVDGKSTSAHAAVLAPNDVKIYIYPDFPSYDNEKVLLIFPGKSAIPFQQWWLENASLKNDSLDSTSHQKNKENDSEYDFNLPHTTKCKKELPFSKVVFIDSTWRQSKALYSDIRIKSLPCVIMSSHKSLFWRPQRGKPDTYLATIEAIYYFLVELHQLAYPCDNYNGQYDNMLFFFKHMYFKIKDIYDEHTYEEKE